MLTLNNHIDDPKGCRERSSFTNYNNMDQKVEIFPQQKQQQQQQQEQKPSNNNNNNKNQEAMRCPRCDSSNTKFCYYNNYSLSQPRHFCKACKRYWTRGGTLRNVPVGGGCRRNKRVKRVNNNNINNFNTTTNNNNNSCSSNTTSNNNNNINNNSITNLHDGSVNSIPSNNNNNMSFYGLLNNNNINSNCDQNLMYFPFSRYDLQNPPQINGLGLGFSNGLMNNGNIFQDLMSSNNNNNNTNNNNNNSISNYGNTSATTTTTTSTTPPTTILPCNNNSFQMKSGVSNNFDTLYEEGGLHMKGSGGLVKMEEVQGVGANRSFDYPWSSAPSQNQVDFSNLGCSSSNDPCAIWGNNSNGISNLGAWLDSSNNHLGSSIPSLI